MKGETSAIRFNEAQKLLDYGFSSYQFANCNLAGDVIRTLSIEKGTFPSIDIITQNSTGAIVAKGSSSNISIEINLPEKLLAPVNENEIVGNISYFLNNEKIATTNLVAATTVKKLTLPNMMALAFEKWFNLLR